MNEKKLYTITVFSENTVGLLNQITIIFTRRAINIETLSVSPSAIEGIHKFTITIFSTEDMVVKVVQQIDKRIDIIKAYYNTDKDLVSQEIALYKIASNKILALGSIEDLIRKHNIRILEMNNSYVVFEKTGRYKETQALFKELQRSVGVLQFIRSGSIAITRGTVERLSDMLSSIEEKLRKRNENGYCKMNSKKEEILNSIETLERQAN